MYLRSINVSYKIQNQLPRSIGLLGPIDWPKFRLS